MPSVARSRRLGLLAIGDSLRAAVELNHPVPWTHFSAPHPSLSRLLEAHRGPCRTSVCVGYFFFLGGYLLSGNFFSVLSGFFFIVSLLSLLVRIRLERERRLPLRGVGGRVIRDRGSQCGRGLLRG